MVLDQFKVFDQWPAGSSQLVLKNAYTLCADGMEIVYVWVSGEVHVVQCGVQRLI